MLILSQQCKHSQVMKFILQRHVILIQYSFLREREIILIRIVLIGTIASISIIGLIIFPNRYSYTSNIHTYIYTHTHPTVCVCIYKNPDLIASWCLGQNFCVCLRTGEGTIVSVLSAQAVQRKEGGRRKLNPGAREHISKGSWLSSAKERFDMQSGLNGTDPKA